MLKIALSYKQFLLQAKFTQDDDAQKGYENERAD